MDLVILRATAATAAAVALAACTPTAATQPVRPEQPATATEAPARTVTATVPPDLLGAGSTIVVVTNARERGAPGRGLATSLEVITDDGVRHPVWTTALVETEAHLKGDFELADWRPELRTALLVDRDGRARRRVTSYDVTTSATHEVTLPRRAISAALDPDGSGILMTLYGTEPMSRTVALTWEGVRTRLPGTGGYPMTSADGRTLVSPAGNGSGWDIVDLGRRRATSIAVPGTCNPIRWIDDDSVLASCYARGGNQLRAVHLDGRSTVLGPFHPIDGAGRVDVTSDGDVVRAQGSRWLLSWSRAGGVLQQQSGRGPVVRVPGTTGLHHLRRVQGDRLLLARSDNLLEVARARGVLEVFDPATGTREVLVRLGRGESFRSVIGATEVRHWNP